MGSVSYGAQFRTWAKRQQSRSVCGNAKGEVVPDLVHAFFSEVAHSISDVLRKKGYGLLIASSDEDPELERREIEQMIAGVSM